MGNFNSCRSAKSTAVGKVILFDGSIQEFDKPITVAELMLEHPQQVVVEFQSAVSKRRAIALPADKKLEMKQTYLMLPIKQGKQPRLTNEETKRFLLIVNSVMRSRSALSSPKFLCCFAKICTRTAVEGGRGKRSEEDNEEYRSQRDRNALLELPETSDERPEYLYKQMSWNGWKPCLDPIEEGNVERKLSRRLSSCSRISDLLMVNY